MFSKSQRKLDRDRKSYLIAFPNNLSEEQLLTWLRSISGTIHTGKGRIFAVQSIVFETWSSDRGIHHRLRVPWQEEAFILSQLQTHIPGISVTPEEIPPQFEWPVVAEIGMSHPDRTLKVLNSGSTAASLLASVQALNMDEVVMMQWVLTPMVPSSMPELDEGGSRDALEDRRKKLQDPNLLSVGRISAFATTKTRAQQLIDSVEKALHSVDSAGTQFKRQLALFGNPSDRVNSASSPHLFPAQLSIQELSGLLAWPIGQPFVAGLPQSTARHLHANEDIARVGRLMGHSNVPGNRRPISLDYRHATKHLYIGGGTGTGKSVMMGNNFAYDVANGHGAIVIDPGNSESNETMFSRAIQYIPKERLDDVIIIDVQAGREHPVGFNILDQGNPKRVVDQLTELFGHLYDDTKGVWTRELLFHGLYTLIEHQGMTFVDLAALVTPRTPQEITWADELKRGVKDPELKQFWQRWENFAQAERDRYSQPLLNRIWQLISRPETRNIIGQSASSFKMTDVLLENKILLVSMSGVADETASLLATLFMNALWDAAQTVTPQRENFLYLDEFQLMTRLPMGLEDMLARARKHKLGVTMATQYLEKIPVELKSAIINNALNRVIFTSSSKEAKTWQQEFGSRFVSQEDLMNTKQHDAFAQFSTDSGKSNPVTLSALAPLESTNQAAEARRLSAQKYGRPIAAIEAETTSRRMGKRKAEPDLPPIGFKSWDG